MTAKQLIKMALGYKDMTYTELAKKLDWSPQLLNKRINTGKFSLDEWATIAEAMGAKAEFHIVFPDGMEI